MSLARADDGTEVELYPDSDNWSRLQALLDAHTAVRLPDGNWPVSKAVNVRTGGQVVGAGADAVTLRMIGTTGEPVVGLGGNNRWASSLGYGPATDVILRGFTMQQSDQSSTNCKCLFVNDECHDFLGEQLRVRGSFYEGIVAGSNCRVVTLRNIEAFDCGNGGSAYAQSTAGINATSSDFTLEDFVCRGCGQGVETGNTRVLVRRGLITEPGAGTPALGINVGSTGYGVYQTTVEDCVIRGYVAAMTCGNGIGRLAAVTFQRNDVDGECTFFGGTLDNGVTWPPQGPTTEGSYFLSNIIRVTGLSNGPFTYNSGIVDNDGLFGREPLTVSRNTVIYDGTAQSTPTFGFAGEISADCMVEFNSVFGLDASPSRGDVASFTLLSNPTIPGMPNLTVRANLAYNNAQTRLRNWTILKG